eukprot:scaffold26225_cov87-Skeletonema_marinoi.AAC.1
MGHWKLWIASFTALDTIWDAVHQAAIPNWASSGHLRRCSMADSQMKSLSSGMYRFYTIVTNHNGPLEAVDCDIHSVRYDMGRSSPGGHPNWASSGHLRRCSMADSQMKSLSSG